MKFRNPDPNYTHPRATWTVEAMYTKVKERALAGREQSLKGTRWKPNHLSDLEFVRWVPEDREEAVMSMMHEDPNLGWDRSISEEGPNKAGWWIYPR